MYGTASYGDPVLASDYQLGFSPICAARPTEAGRFYEQTRVQRALKEHVERKLHSKRGSQGYLDVTCFKVIRNTVKPVLTFCAECINLRLHFR